MDASVLLYLIDYQSTCGRSAGIFFSSLKQLRTAQWNALFDMAISYQVFGYLDRVQCRSFTDLVADTRKASPFGSVISLRIRPT